jgi:sporulation protein YlmC with PRC-barrel domain
MYVNTPAGSVTTRTTTTPRPALAQSGHTEKASKVIGMAVVNKENKKCGDVDNLIVDLPTARLIHVVVSSGGFLGVGDALNAIPPTRFQYAAARDALQIDLTKEDLTRAPNFKSTEWPDFTDVEYSTKVYRSYNVEPYFDADRPNAMSAIASRMPSLRWIKARMRPTCRPLAAFGRKSWPAKGCHSMRAT